jgi:hypothetical protein
MRLLLVLCWLLSSVSATLAQSNPLIRSAELLVQKAVFDPSVGLALKADHTWVNREKFSCQSGLMLSGLLAPGASPYTTGTTQEVNGSLRAQVHTGITRSLSRSHRWYLIAELFVGLRVHVVRGSLDQPSQGFEREVAMTTWQPDWGSHVGLGYRFGEHLGVVLTLTNSWRELNNPLGVPAGLFFWGPDVLALGGIGLTYRI